MLLLPLEVTVGKLLSQKDTEFDTDLTQIQLFCSPLLALVEGELPYETYVPLLHLRSLIRSTLASNQKQALATGLISTNCLPG